MTLQQTYEAALKNVSDLFTRLCDGEDVMKELEVARVAYNNVCALMGATDRNEKNYRAEDKNDEVWTVVTYRGGTYRFRGVLSREEALAEAAAMAEEFVY